MRVACGLFRSLGREAMNLMNFALYNDAEPQKKPKKKYTPEKEVVCRVIVWIVLWNSQ